VSETGACGCYRVKGERNVNDIELLRQFARTGSEESFRELVNRHTAMVYACAVQRLGDRHAAQDVTQAVFVALALKAKRLGPRTRLSGWLYRATRFACAKHQRREQRRREREMRAAIAIEEQDRTDEQSPAWETLLPHLAHALDTLSARDREAVLMRFYREAGHREIGEALGVSEDAAQKRVSRALARMKKCLARKGVALPVTGLAAALTTSAASAAPAGLAKLVGTTALAVAGGTQTTAGVMALAEGVTRMMLIAKMKTTVLVTTACLAVAATGFTAASRLGGKQSERAVTAAVGGPLAWIRSSCFGSPGNDNFEGAAVGPDGSLYLVGNAGESIRTPGGNVDPVRFGVATADPRCGCGFVLKLSGDASKVLAYAEFAGGILHATGIAVTDDAVYLGGFASHGLEPLLKERSGLIVDYPLQAARQRAEAEKQRVAAGGAPKSDPIADRPSLGRLGAPCVLRLSTDLRILENGTYLEGWQQVYDKRRVCGAGRTKLDGPFREFFWQPINICPLASGDVVVSHDGGYFREVTDADRQLAAKVASEKDREKLLERFGFYDVADYVSRLSADLTRRAWKTDVYTPPTDPAVAGRLKNGWPHRHFGNPRIHRMRMGPGEAIWICGWSATLTSSEPWWSPFVWRLDPETGKPTRRLYEYDPMSGGGNRMGGTVADTAALSVAVEDDGDLLTCLIADGGNTWMGRGPRGNEGERMKGPVSGPGLGPSPAHFWGQVHRADAETFDGLGGAKTGPWAWTIDAAGLPDEHFLALGRWNRRLRCTANAWWTDADVKLPNPNAFLRVVGPDYDTVFWTAIPGVRPYELLPLGDNRYIVTGFAAADGGAPIKDGLTSGAAGGEDAWFAVVEWRGHAPVKLVRASFFGTAGDDDIQGCCAGPDGSIYIAGITGESQGKLGGVKPVKLGDSVDKPMVGHAFVAKLSKAGDKVLGYAELGKGIASFTTVKAGTNGVYVSGYASEGLESVIKDVPGLIKDYPLDRQVKLLKEGKWSEAVGESPGKNPIPEEPRRQLGRYGAPCVLRFDADLKTLQGGTYLEGWQTVWEKRRCISTKPVWKCWPAEYYWQPALVEILDSGDVVICHDGGYFRLLTDEDEAFVEKTVARLVAEKWLPGNKIEEKRAAAMSDEQRREYYRSKLRSRFGFYHVCDYLSRLGAGLDRRVYVKPIYTPATDRKVVAKLKYGWPYAHFGNPRTHRMCLDEQENIYLCGWAASFTSQEPWWSYFFWKMSPEDGRLIEKIKEKNPMSGPNHRMRGVVADKGIHACAVRGKSFWHNTYSDSGAVGLVHFAGTLCRSDRATMETLGSVSSSHSLSCSWITDLEPLPEEYVLAMGRCNYKDDWPEDAWQGSHKDENPVAFFSVYDNGKAMQPAFTSAIRGVLPYELAALGDGRFMLVGQSVANVLWKKKVKLEVDPNKEDKGEKKRRRRKADYRIDIIEEPNPGVAVTKDPLYEKHQGGADGYFMIIDCK